MRQRFYQRFINANQFALFRAFENFLFPQLYCQVGEIKVSNLFIDLLIYLFIHLSV